jgi:hypothetical protein
MEEMRIHVAAEQGRKLDILHLVIAHINHRN